MLGAQPNARNNTGNTVRASESLHSQSSNAGIALSHASRAALLVGSCGGGVVIVVVTVVVIIVVTVVVIIVVVVVVLVVVVLTSPPPPALNGARQLSTRSLDRHVAAAYTRCWSCCC